MGININKIMMVRRANMRLRVGAMPMEIFSNFLFYVVQYVSMIQPDQDGSNVFKKLDHSAKCTFCHKAEIP